MAIESLDTEKEIMESAESTTKEETAETPGGGTECASDEKVCPKKRPSPVKLGDTDEESPAKKVVIDVVEEESVECMKEAVITQEFVGNPAAEEQPTAEVAAEGQKAEEDTNANNPSSEVETPHEPVSENELVKDAETADKDEPQVEVADGPWETQGQIPRSWLYAKSLALPVPMK